MIASNEASLTGKAVSTAQKCQFMSAMMRKAAHALVHKSPLEIRTNPQLSACNRMRIFRNGLVRGFGGCVRNVVYRRKRLPMLAVYTGRIKASWNAADSM